MPPHRNPPLTVDEIVETALALTVASGLGGLSMRAVAAELGVTPMSVYHHVGDREGLVARVADAVVAGVREPDPGLPWDRWLSSYHDALGQHLPAYPGVAQHLLDHPSTPAGAAIRRRTVEVLVAGGFDRRTALLAASTFHTHLLGRLAVGVLPPAEQRDDEPAWRQLGLTADDYADFGLQVLLAGIRAQRAVTRGPPPSRGPRRR